ncbi:MAG: hypothetical protein U0236_21350 [Nitrospira sp.]
MPLAMLGDIPTSVTTTSGTVITLTPDEEQAAFKSALQRAVEESVFDSLNGHVERRRAVYNALGLAAGIALGGLIAGVLLGRRS